MALLNPSLILLVQVIFLLSSTTAFQLPSSSHKKSAVQPASLTGCSITHRPAIRLYMVDEEAPSDQETSVEEGDGEEAAEEEVKEPTEAELLQKEFDDLEKQLSALEVKAKEAADNVLESGKTGYMRAAADVDNYKRALAKDLDQVKKTSMAGALTGFMPILDRFEEVYGAFDPAATPEGEAKLYGSYHALYGQLTLGFEKLGMAQYRAEVGEAYSVLRHEKTQEVESEAKKGTVVEALAPGMELGGSIIRPARVVVSAGMPEPPNAEEEDLEVSQEAATEGEESEESDISSSGEKEGVVGEEKEGGKGKKKRRGKKTKRRRE
uniref:GrpE protein homolog n=1 Tax=Heterosigma akashiwo TaxID=2829 RepID=A0A7S3XSE7_HETAK